MNHKKFTRAYKEIQRQVLTNTRVFGDPTEMPVTDDFKNAPDFNYDYKEKFRRPPKPPPPKFLIDKFRITPYALSAIEYYIGRIPAESGGMLLSQSHDYKVTGFIFDYFGSNTGSTAYQPNTKYLNHFLADREPEIVGIVHSHPANYRKPSPQDERAAWSNITSPGNPHLQAFLMPIVMTIPDTGKFEIIPYSVTCNPTGAGKVVVKPVKLEILG
jgi:hypothetical protein